MGEVVVESEVVGVGLVDCGVFIAVFEEIGVA